MRTYLALMRAINVGNRQMPMADLRALAQEIGFERPQTYIASGNLIFDHHGDPRHVRDILEQAIERRFGFRAEAIVRTADQWRDYCSTNPFDGDAAAIDKMVHLCLTVEPPKADAVDRLNERAQPGERIARVGEAIWIDFGPGGVGSSKLMPAYMDKCAGSTLTARNWNSVRKLRDMLDARTKGAGA